ncbi:MAG: flagellar hook-associated protein FlgK [Cognatishimia sp.]|uniref:flagellar hook-associated protein FlgK n=1 Tax=Cognatishimia sp. TaxID=2211648 RepID=UPI004058DED7
MSITSALNSATAGLRVQQTLSRVAAENVANATTEGYTRRSATVVSTSVTGGVSVGEVRREVDTSLQRMARLENARMSEQQAIYEGLRDYSIFLGELGDGNSPAERYAEFSSTMTTLVNMPSSSGAQAGAILAAENLISSINHASERLASVRANVDMEIRYEVSDLNEKLYELADLNTKLHSLSPNSFESVAYSDRVEQIVDDISSMVDVRVSHSSSGWISVYTTGGAALMEGDRVYDITFNQGDGTFWAGSQEITPTNSSVRGIEHGTLSGFAYLRNETIPTFQLQLDEFARGLIQAFENADTSLGAADAGLFTDNGGRFDSANLDGLASRISINSRVEGAATGTSWLIRDGLAATSESENVSDATQIQTFITAMNSDMNADPMTGINSSVSLADYAAEMISSQGTTTARAENNYNAARSAAEVVEASRRNIEGVSIDEEMQNLMLIEQSFAANSQMLSTIGEMIDTLLAIF